MLLACSWIVAIPVAWLTSWLYSLAFISACSIYANATGHLAAWRADELPGPWADTIAKAVVKELKSNG
jgi:hypothetical protein